jgi:transcriptional regulator with XRE-family HTH domain
MRSKISQKILSETPLETRSFVKKYAAIIVRINQLLEHKGWNQKQLADAMGKAPAEISKWLNGNHNLTLKSLVKLEVELNGIIIDVANPFTYNTVMTSCKRLTMTVTKQDKINVDTPFADLSSYQYKEAI